MTRTSTSTGAAAPRTGSSDSLSALRFAGPALLVAAALATMIWALLVGGGAAPIAIGDAGPVVRWALPVTTLFVNLSAAGMVGALVLSLFALRAGEKPFGRAMDAATFSAGVFTVAAAATGYLTYLSIFNAKVDLGMQAGQQLADFLVQVEAGRTWLITTIAGAILTILVFAVRSWTGTLLVAILALASLVPMGTQGHSGDLATHNIAATSLILHMMGAAAWIGGLFTVVIVRPHLKGKELTPLLSRYSTVALVAFVIVAVSGIARGLLGIGDLAGLFSPYGLILAVKVVALLVIGLLGAVYRLRLIDRMRESAASRLFWRLIVVEFIVMGVASGAAVALARTPPPAGELPLSRTPAEVLTRAPLPPELTLERWFTQWNLDLLWAVVIGFALFFYLAGAWRLHRRGDKWPIYRTICWVVGLLWLLWVTCGPVNAYQDYLFSVHMIGHMTLTMAIPLLLVAGAPVTLAARSIHKRDDGTRGGREWILWAVHTPFARVITNPWVAAGIFVGSLWVFYYTDLFRWALYDHLGHEWMTVHFLISGYLFVQSLIGIDPVPYRAPYPFRLLTLIAVMAIHAFFGIAIMMQTGLMVAEWYGSMGRTWGPTPLQDQYIGGGAAWSIGELPTLVLAIVVAMQWSRSDERLQKRRDRHADRTGDAELEEYNARLAALAARDARTGGR